MSKSRAKAYSLLEVLVSLAVLLIGVVMIVHFFPQFLRSASDAEFKTRAALLAQMKVEEIRRDDDTSNTLVSLISMQPLPTVEELVPFTQEPRLSYAFSGQSFLHDVDDPPQGDPGVARVVIRYAPTYRNTGTSNTKDILYELRFGP